MGFFDKLKNPIFLKEDSEADKQLAALRELRNLANGNMVDKIDQEISKVEAGIYGEKQIHFELENSHIPMFVIHDLFLEHEGLKAQIDYFIVTRKNMYVVECKNLYGNIEIDNTGSFIRTFQYNGRYFKEGIYSPITQNQRHLALIKTLRGSVKNFVMKALFEKNFEYNYHGIVVLANPKTVLYDKYAKKEVKDQVIRADQLIGYIKKKDAAKNTEPYSDKDMEEIAYFFMEQNMANPVDYTERFRKLIEDDKTDRDVKQSNEVKEETAQPTCPKCGAPMVLRTAKKGNNSGNQFYGCTNFPKCRGVKSL